MPESAVRAWLDDRHIVVEGSSLRPIQQFSQSGASIIDPLKNIWETKLTSVAGSLSSVLNSSAFYSAELPV